MGALDVRLRRRRCAECRARVSDARHQRRGPPGALPRGLPVDGDHQTRHAAHGFAPRWEDALTRVVLSAVALKNNLNANLLSNIKTQLRNFKVPQSIRRPGKCLKQKSNVAQPRHAARAHASRETAAALSFFCSSWLRASFFPGLRYSALLFSCLALFGVQLAVLVFARCFFPDCAIRYSVFRVSHD